MPFTSLGESDGKAPATPTLRAVIESGIKLPAQSTVIRVFKPSKSPSYGIVCDHGFRVNVYEDSPLFAVLTRVLESCMVDGTTLAVAINFDKPGAFELVIDENTQTAWEERTWGWKAERFDTRKQRAAKKNGRTEA